jgi:hypothetical protein
MPDPTKRPEGPALMIAGPGQLHDEDLAVFGRQVIAHYGDAWTAYHGEVIELLGRALGASDAPYLIPGTGTTCLDMAMFNLFEAGRHGDGGLWLALDGVRSSAPARGRGGAGRGRRPGRPGARCRSG